MSSTPPRTAALRDARVSARGRASPRSAIRKLAGLATAAEERGVRVYSLNIGQPDIETPGVLFDTLRDLDMKVLAYGPSRGMPEYLRALEDYYGRHNLDVGFEDMVVTVGGSEALLLAMLVCCDAGDSVLTPEPFYTNYASFAHQAGVTLAPLTTRVEDGYHLPDRQTMEAALHPNTRAVLFSNPGNPTGVVYTREELRALADFALDHELFIIADEVYREFVFDDRRHVSILEFDDLRRHAVMADSCSKRYSACGARVGALVSRNRAVVEAALRLAEARLCAPTLGQMVGVRTLEETSAYLEKVHHEYQRRRDVVVRKLSSIEGVVFAPPEGAFYAQAQLPVDDAERFARWMLTDFAHQGSTVFVAPGTGFYVTPGLGTREVRIAFVLDEEDLAAALDVLAAGLRAYRDGGTLE